MPNPKLETYKNKATGTVYDLTDADAQSKVTATVDLMKDTTGWVGLNKLNAKFKNSDTPNIVVTPHYDANGLLEYVNLNGNNPDGEKILIQFAARLDGDLILPNGNYKFSIGVSNENIKLQVGRNSSGPTSGSFVLLATSSYGDSDLSFTQDQPYGLTVQIFAKANSTFDNVKVYPMVCTTEQYALSPTYEPYHESVEEYAFPRSEQAVLGAKNIITIDGTSSGIFTINADNTVTVNGDGASEKVLSTYKAIPSWLGNCYLSGGKSANKKLVIGFRDASNTWLGDIDNTSGDTAITIPANATEYQIKLVIGSGITLDNEVFYPMLSFDGGEFALYAMTNRELTEVLKYRNVRLKDVPNEGSIYDKVVNVAEQLDTLVTDIGVKFSGYVLWTQSMFLRVEAMRCNATTLLYTIFNASYTIYNGNVQNGVVSVYKFEGTQMTS